MHQAVELLTSICGNDGDLWHKVVAKDLADDGNIWAVFRTADDCVLRMLLANVFRRMSNVSVPCEQIYDLETVVPGRLHNKRTDQAFIGAAIDLINSLNTKSTFNDTRYVLGVSLDNIRLIKYRQSHIFRAYIDSNSTQRLAQVADRVTIILDSAITVLCVSQDEAGFDRITIPLSTGTKCIWDSADAQSATVVVNPHHDQKYFYERGQKFNLTDFLLTFDTLPEGQMFYKFCTNYEDAHSTGARGPEGYRTSTPDKSVPYMASLKPPPDDTTSDPVVVAGKMPENVFGKPARTCNTNLGAVLRASQEDVQISRADVAVPTAYVKRRELLDVDASSPLKLTSATVRTTPIQRVASLRPDPTLTQSMCSANDKDFAKFSTTNSLSSRVKKTYRKSRIASSRPAQNGGTYEADIQPIRDTTRPESAACIPMPQQSARAIEIPEQSPKNQATTRKTANKRGTHQEGGTMCQDQEAAREFPDLSTKNLSGDPRALKISKISHTRLRTRSRPRKSTETSSNKEVERDEGIAHKTEQPESGFAKQKKSKSSATTVNRRKCAAQKSRQPGKRDKEPRLSESAPAVLQKTLATTRSRRSTRTRQVTYEQVSSSELDTVEPIEDLAEDTHLDNDSSSSVHVAKCQELKTTGNSHAPTLGQYDDTQPDARAPEQETSQIRSTSPDYDAVEGLDHEDVMDSAVVPQADSPDKSFAAKLMEIAHPPAAGLRKRLSQRTSKKSIARTGAPSEVALQVDNDRSDIVVSAVKNVPHEVNAAATGIETTGSDLLVDEGRKSIDDDEHTRPGTSNANEVRPACEHSHEAHSNSPDAKMADKTQLPNEASCDSESGETQASNVLDGSHLSLEVTAMGDTYDTLAGRPDIPLWTTPRVVWSSEQLNGPRSTILLNKEDGNARSKSSTPLSARKSTILRPAGNKVKHKHALRTPIVHFSASGPANRGIPNRKRVSSGPSSPKVVSEGPKEIAIVVNDGAQVSHDQEASAFEHMGNCSHGTQQVMDNFSASKPEHKESLTVLDDIELGKCDHERSRASLPVEEPLANCGPPPRNEIDRTDLCMSGPDLPEQEESYSFETEAAHDSEQDSDSDFVDVTFEATNPSNSEIALQTEEDSKVPVERPSALQQESEVFCTEYSPQPERKKPAMVTAIVLPPDNLIAGRITAAHPGAPSKPKAVRPTSRSGDTKRVLNVFDDLRDAPRPGSQRSIEANRPSSVATRVKRRIDTETMPPPPKPSKIARFSVDAVSSMPEHESAASVMKEKIKRTEQNEPTSITVTRLVNKSSVHAPRIESLHAETVAQNTPGISHTRGHAKDPTVSDVAAELTRSGQVLVTDHNADKTLVGRVTFPDIRSRLPISAVDDVESSPMQSPLDTRGSYCSVVIPAHRNSLSDADSDPKHQLAVSMQKMVEVSVLVLSRDRC